MNLWPDLPEGRRHEWLTPKEREVFSCIVDRGLSTAGTASCLKLSSHTVLVYRKNINHKLRSKGVIDDISTPKKEPKMPPMRIFRDAFLKDPTKWLKEARRLDRSIVISDEDGHTVAVLSVPGPR